MVHKVVCSSICGSVVCNQTIWIHKVGHSSWSTIQRVYPALSSALNSEGQTCANAPGRVSATRQVRHGESACNGQNAFSIATTVRVGKTRDYWSPRGSLNN